MFTHTGMPDLGYADDAGLLSENSSRLRVFLDGLNDSVGVL